MAQVYAAIANGGTLWTPQVAAAVRTPGPDVRTMAPKAGTVPLRDVLTFLHTRCAGS